ncbi:Nodulation receptor kinase [Heracleum sosnowskyi]|uniref:Nodulation receptor kinase n=1 Tax=Heracleum sosnowskyi TaxID=360622 RepID=A0AAD8HFV6_9APIA|nr:Nodulation receptor kinase [Heracleum sosnowskyi]
MRKIHKLLLILGIPTSCIILLLLFVIYIWFFKNRPAKDELKEANLDKCKESDDVGKDDILIKFRGCENLTVHDILDAPGEVIGKSGYGTLYRASLLSADSVMLLRFLRPTCTGKLEQIVPLIQVLGSIRHPNLVPLCAFYAGPRGEKLLVYPFYSNKNLAQFIRDEDGDTHKWTVISKISTGIARALDYLHKGLQKPLFHGNLKSKNIYLGHDYQPYVSDFGIHQLLNPTAAQEMLEGSAAEGYKAPELIKMKDTGEQADIYSLGVIFLELLSGKEPVIDQDLYLPSSMRAAVLDHRLSDLYHPDILLGESNGQTPVTEENVLKFFQLAMSCCSPSPSLRPDTTQILKKLEELA